ncbi:hypothetical protein IQ266_25170 [filamentous cyanobacterium LEGE 11480]|uniref:ParE-like toxin domain-containing protein n=1 Tax=Romeriopsis navalis LEGE 11480 TaxID=2777977 RepID=A0A928Z6H9_9CYAN|nr:hypothetical protein [Romeriopsis navalis LEGE 11480]
MSSQGLAGVDLRRLPQAICEQAQGIWRRIQAGVHPGAIGGKWLRGDRGLMRVPVGYRYRLLMRRGARGFEPTKLLSHESYNAVSRRNCG